MVTIKTNNITGKEITEYTSVVNGYKGIMYGESSFSIYDPYGREVLHTDHRDFEDIQSLVDAVDYFPG